MGKILTHMTMSLDGYIADADDQVGELFDWYQAGDVSVPTPNENLTFRVDAAGAEMLRELTENAGALVRPTPVRHRRRLERQPSCRLPRSRRHTSPARGCRAEMAENELHRRSRGGSDPRQTNRR